MSGTGGSPPALEHAGEIGRALRKYRPLVKQIAKRMALIVGFGLLQPANTVDRATFPAARLQLVPPGTERAIIIGFDINAGIEPHAFPPALQPGPVTIIVSQHKVYALYNQYTC